MLLREHVRRRLQQDRCPFRVAVFAGTNPDLGAFVEVHAFDVPVSGCTTVSRRLNHLLWGVDPVTNVVAGAFGTDESTERLTELPDDVTWYEPVGAVLPVTEYVAAPATMVRDGKPPARPAL